MTIGRRIMNSLRRFSGEAPRDGEKASGVIMPAAAPPAVRYVNALLTDLIGRRRNLTIRPFDGLPALAGDRVDPPPFAVVVNRLKVLAGLDPISYPKPVAGKFEFVAGDRKHLIEVRFDDNPRNPCCLVAVTDRRAGA